MSGGERFFSWFIYLLAALMIAGVTHIVSILALPYLASRDGYARLSDVTAENVFTLLPRAAPGEELLPYEDPAVLLGACRFNLADGPVRVRAPLSAVDGLLLISFHSRRGATFYGMTDRGGLRGALDVLLLTRPQLDVVEAFDPEDELPEELRLTPPTERGFVLVRSFVMDELDRPSARRRLESVTCAQESAERTRR